MTSGPNEYTYITEDSDERRNIPESGLAAVACAAVAGRRGTVVVRRRGGAGLSWLRNNLTGRRIATGRGSRSSLLLEVIVLLERHDGGFRFLVLRFVCFGGP